MNTVDTFHVLADLVRGSFEKFKGQPLFKTDAKQKIWDAYLNGFDDPNERQGHNCQCCRSFLQKYGHLVTINEKGNTEPVMWRYIPPLNIPLHMFKSVQAVAKLCVDAKVTGPFHANTAKWGDVEKGGFHHFAVEGPIFLNKKLTAGQMMSLHQQEYSMLRRGLSEISREVFNQAVVILSDNTTSASSCRSHRSMQRRRSCSTTMVIERTICCGVCWCKKVLHSLTCVRLRLVLSCETCRQERLLVLQ